MWVPFGYIDHTLMLFAPCVLVLAFSCRFMSLLCTAGTSSGGALPMNMAAAQEAVVATTIGSVGCGSFPLCTPQPDLVPPAVTLGAAKTHDERDILHSLFHCCSVVAAASSVLFIRSSELFFMPRPFAILSGC